MAAQISCADARLVLFGSQLRACFAPTTHDRPDMWTLAHASKDARANQFPALLSAKENRCVRFSAPVCVRLPAAEHN